MKTRATVRGAFLYPPTESLKKRGYYSWPGIGFDPEGRQKEYMKHIEGISKRLGMEISVDERPLHEPEAIERFVKEVEAERPDGLLLIPFQKGMWEFVGRIVEEISIPTVVMVPLGVLLNPQINQLYRKPGVYLINSLDNFGAHVSADLNPDHMRSAPGPLTWGSFWRLSSNPFAKLSTGISIFWKNNKCCYIFL